MYATFVILIKLMQVFFSVQCYVVLLENSYGNLVSILLIVVRNVTILMRLAGQFLALLYVIKRSTMGQLK